MTRADVVVVGSLNLDIVVPVPHQPRPGETVLGGDHHRNPGGKGANQAVAAARLGASTAMIGRVGDDDFADTLRGALTDDGVDVEHVRTTEGVPTGIAVITVDEEGENSIAVSPGANGRVSADDIAAAADLVRDASVVLCQLETPVEVARAAAETTDGIMVLNPAPAADLPPALLAALDVLVPNRDELARLTGADEPETIEDAVALARRIEGPDVVIVTLGADGALLVQGDDVVHVPPHTVDVVDTTGAGDTFSGALAAALVRGDSYEDAVREAVVAAALATTGAGAQSAMPTRGDVEKARA